MRNKGLAGRRDLRHQSDLGFSFRGAAKGIMLQQAERQAVVRRHANADYVLLGRQEVVCADGGLHTFISCDGGILQRAVEKAVVDGDVLAAAA